jgi:cell division protein FtsN
MKSTKFFWFAVALTVLAGCGDPKREQALEEIRTLETKREEFESSDAQLKKFQVIHARFIMREQEFGNKQPIIELTVKNKTDQAVTRAYFEATLASPGRRDPWYRDRFNYIISGGLKPGEEATWYLETNMFSGWAKVESPADAALTVTVEEIDGADGRPIHVAREFPGRERERLAELKMKYGVESTQVLHAVRHDDRKTQLSVSGQKDTKPDMLPELPGQEKKIESAPQSSAHAADGVQEAPAPAAEKPAHKPPLYHPPAENKTPPPAPAAAQTARPAAARPAPKASEPLTYTLQLGSFKNKNAATSFSRSLAARGYKPHIVKITVPDKGITYRVRLGKYKHLKDAQKMVAALVKKEGLSAIIISL